MNKYNVQIVAIVTAGVVLVSAIFASGVILASSAYGKGLFDYLIAIKK